MKIIFKALAGNVRIGNNNVDKLYLRKDIIKIFNNIDCQEEFVQYMDNNIQSKLYDGYMRFIVENYQLYVITEYNVREDCILEYSEIEKLKEYTQGQWSDGIGENFEQEPCAYIDEFPVYISPWFKDQQIKTIIE